MNTGVEHLGRPAPSEVFLKEVCLKGLASTQNGLRLPLRLSVKTNQKRGSAKRSTHLGVSGFLGLPCCGFIRENFTRAPFRFSSWSLSQKGNPKRTPFWAPVWASVSLVRSTACSVTTGASEVGFGNISPRPPPPGACDPETERNERCERLVRGSCLGSSTWHGRVGLKRRKLKSPPLFGAVK